MLIQELQQSIINNDIFNKYGSKLVFTGEDSYLQKLYINQIAKINKAKLIYAESYLDIKRSLTTTTMMDKNTLFVIRNTNEFNSNIELFNQVIPAKNKWLILIYDKMDKRSSFFKEVEKITCNFEKMTEEQLLHIIRKNYKSLDKLNDDNCYRIIDLVNKDYGRLLLELDKLNIILPIKEKEAKENCLFFDEINDLFKILIKDGLIHQDIDNNVFNLVDVILNKQYMNIHILHKNAKNGEFDVFSLMGLLYINYKNTLLYKCSKDINLSGFIKNKISTFMDKYTVPELISKLQIIQEMEQGIKTGKVDSLIADEILLIRLLYE